MATFVPRPLTKAVAMLAGDFTGNHWDDKFHGCGICLGGLTLDQPDYSDHYDTFLLILISALGWVIENQRSNLCHLLLMINYDYKHSF